MGVLVPTLVLIMRKIIGIDERRRNDSGLIAQLEERRLCKAEAGGSNPPEST